MAIAMTPAFFLASAVATASEPPVFTIRITADGGYSGGEKMTGLAACINEAQQQQADHVLISASADASPDATSSAISNARTAGLRNLSVEIADENAPSGHD